jgi:glycosyltransferase involved in cell wall biosynthesis
VNLEELKSKRIAFVHDWLTGMRGGEKVLEQMVKVLGPRDLYSLVALPEKLSPCLLQCRIKTSFIQNLPFAQKKHQHYLPLFPLAIESFDFSEYDLVISTSHCVAKGIITRPHVFHFTYMHTPMRYIWDFYEVYKQAARPRILMKFLWPAVMHYLRIWDCNTNHRYETVVGNSLNIVGRIKKYYGREAACLYPPVDAVFYTPDTSDGDYYFIVGAHVPYKRFDLAVRACKKLNRRLIVAGNGPETARLKEIAKDSSCIEFVGRVSDEQLLKYYRGAKAFLFPGEEDFGITPLESQACGVGVIAYGKGGALETVIEGKTGTFFSEQTESSMIEAIKRYEALTLDKNEIRKHAEAFSNECFQESFAEILLSSYGKFLSK